VSFLFDNLFQKQNPELASEMAKRGLIFDRIKHRWVKNPENRAQPKTAPKEYFSGSEGLTDKDGVTHSVKYMKQGNKMDSPVLVYLDDKPYKQFWHFKVARRSMRLEIAGGTKRTTHIANRVVRSGKKGRPPGKTSGRTPRPLKERKWKIGKYVPHDKELYSYRTGSNIGSVLVPEAIEGTASIAKVGSDGRILAWLMRHEPVEDALKFIKEREKIDSYDKD